MRNRATAALSLMMVVLGLAVIARTVAAGVGGGLGLVLGGMLVAAGALRFYLSARSVGSRPGKARSAPRRRAS
jgi:hypothetical protein